MSLESVRVCSSVLLGNTDDRAKTTPRTDREEWIVMGCCCVIVTAGGLMVVAGLPRLTQADVVGIVADTIFMIIEQ
jgi:hypothetical protein